MFSAKYSITTRVVITSNEVVCAFEEKLEDTKKTIRSREDGETTQ
jgi:hypothetical protein